MTGIVNPYSFGDPYFQDVYLLLHGNGSNGGTTFTDSSRFNRTVGANGNVVTSTAVSKFNGSSILFDGTNDFLSFDDPDFAFLYDMSVNFTVEAWVYLTSFATYRSIMQHGDNTPPGTSFTFDIEETTGSPYYALNTPTNGTQTTRSLALTLSTFAHVAATFNATTGTMNCWQGGGLAGTVLKPTGTPSAPGTDVRIGSYLNGAFDWIGNMAEIRITKNVDRYPVAFTPPTAPFPNF